MAIQALTKHVDPAHTKKVERNQVLQAGADLKDKTFEQLSPAEKEQLLKLVAIRLGFIKAE